MKRRIKAEEGGDSPSETTAASQKRVPRFKVQQRQVAVPLQSDLLEPTGFCRHSRSCNISLVPNFTIWHELSLPLG